MRKKPGRHSKVSKYGKVFQAGSGASKMVVKKGKITTVVSDGLGGKTVLRRIKGLPGKAQFNTSELSTPGARGDRKDVARLAKHIRRAIRSEWRGQWGPTK